MLSELPEWRKNLGKGFMNQITRLVVVSWGRATRAKKKALAEQKKLEEEGGVPDERLSPFSNRPCASRALLVSLPLALVHTSTRLDPRG